MFRQNDDALLLMGLNTEDVVPQEYENYGSMPIVTLDSVATESGEETPEWKKILKASILFIYILAFRTNMKKSFDIYCF